jgi:hypothetical protein
MIFFQAGEISVTAAKAHQKFLVEETHKTKKQLM